METHLAIGRLGCITVFIAFLRPLHEYPRWTGLYETAPEQVVQER